MQQTRASRHARPDEQGQPPGDAPGALDVGAGLRHPLFVAALVLLLLNDHVLKAATPGLLTGKLSDAVGPVVAGAVLAFITRRRSVRGVALCFAAAVAFVAAINTAPGFAGAVEAATGALADALAGPGGARWLRWQITVDPSDLLALVAVVPMAAVLVAAMKRAASDDASDHASDDAHLALPARARRRGATLALAAAGALASMATSEGPPLVGEPFFNEPLGWDAHLVLANLSAETRSVRVRRLAPEVALDCAAIAASPTERIDRALFGPGQTFQIPADRTMPLGGTLLPAQLGLDPKQFATREGCDAVLVDGGGLPMRLVFFRTDAFPMKGVSSLASTAALDRRVAFNAASGAGSDAGADAGGGAGGDGLVWQGHSALYAAPPEQPGAPLAGCELLDEGAAIDVSAPTSYSAPARGGALGGFEGDIDSISVDNIGCHEVRFVGKNEALWVCLPAGAMPFAAGDHVSVHFAPLAAGGGTLEGIEIVGKEARLRAGRGKAPVALPIKGSWWLVGRAQCGLAHGACGEVGRAQDLELDLGAGAKPLHLGAGEKVALSADEDLYYIGGAELFASDLGCREVLGAPGVVVESVYVKRSKP